MNFNKIKANWKPLSILIAALGLGLLIGIWLGRMTEEPKTSQAEISQQKTLYTCPMHPQVIQEEPGQCPICGMNLVPMETDTSAGKAEASDAGRKIVYWVAPMDPTYISDRPGKSPMGMDLVPVYEEDEPGAGGALKIDPSLIQTMGVRTHEVERGPLVRTVRTVGTFEVNEESLAIINSKIEGWIEKLYINQTGQAVNKGDPLLSIYSPSLVSAQEEYLSARRHLESIKESPYEDVIESARALVKASEQRLRYWDISTSQIKSLEKAGQTTKTLTLYAPTTGVVIHKNAVEGMEVKPGQDLFKIADLKTLWLQARLYEQDLPWVSEGDEAVIEVDYLPGETLSGRVAYLYPYLDEKTRDITARIEVGNTDMRLKPGMFATVTIKHTATDEAVIIPDEAVIRSGERNVVFIDLGGGRFSPREVALGLTGDGRVVEVRSGIQPGERVVTSAQFMLDSESRLQEAIKKMLESRKSEALMEHQHEAHEHDMAKAEDDASKTYYTCPMESDKDVVSEEPGKCPKCGMELVPVDEVPYDHPLKHRH